LFITLVIFGLQVLRTSKAKISAVTKPGEVLLAGTTLHPTHLRVHITGWIDGAATIAVPGHDPSTIGPGNIEWKFSEAWGDPTCLLKYTPSTVTMGSLEIEYRID
jgi:hypothetical protein